MVVLGAVYGTAELYDFLVGQFVDKPNNWWRAKDAIAFLSWEQWTVVGLAIALALVFEAGYRASSTKSEYYPPKNRDALISTFTELGHRAITLSGERRGDQIIKKFSDDKGFFGNSNSVVEALRHYREAILATEKQINIVGGDLGRVLRLKQQEIRNRLSEDQVEELGLEPTDPPPQSVQDTVKETIGHINGGRWSTDN